MANINKISVAGPIYEIQDQNASKTVELTQAEYDGLAVKNPNTFYIITDAQGGDLSNYYTKGETDTLLGEKQSTLVSGTNLKTINNESLLGEGNIDIQGGGGSITVDTSLDSGSTNAIANNAVTNNTLSGGVESDIALGVIRFWKNNGQVALYRRFGTINGKHVMVNGTTGEPHFQLVETSAVTTSVSSTSTDSQVPSAKAVYDQLGGLKLVKLSQSQYDALQTKDQNTLYIING